MKILAAKTQRREEICYNTIVMTSRDEDKYLDILRKIPTNKKLESAFELYEFARRRISSELRRQNPQASEMEISKLLKERFAAND